MPLINSLTVGVTLKIILADGTKDSINIQPKGKVSLPAGAVVDPAYVAEYNQYIVNTASGVGTGATASLQPSTKPSVAASQPQTQGRSSPIQVNVKP